MTHEEKAGLTAEIMGDLLALIDKGSVIRRWGHLKDIYDQQRNLRIEAMRQEIEDANGNELLISKIKEKYRSEDIQAEKEYNDTILELKNEVYDINIYHMNLQKLNGYLKDLKSSIEEDFENEEVILNYSPSWIVDLKNIRCITCTLISNLELIDQKAIKYFMNQIDYISDMFNCTPTGNVVHLAANKFDEISITLDWFRALGIESLPNRIVKIDVKFQPPTKHVESFKNYNIYSR